MKQQAFLRGEEISMSTHTGRRSSIFWALILIGVGVLFLLQNFNPSIHPWHVIAKFWPLLIIFWGISKVVDYFRARAHPESAPSSLFSGGEVVLLILILIFGTLASKVILRPWHEWPSMLGMQDQEFAELFLNSYTFTQRISQDVKGNPHLLIVNGRGNVEIRASDQPDIGVVLQETVWAENEAAARNIADQLKVHFLENGSQYELESNLDSLPHGGRNIRMDLLVHTPKAASVELTDNRGDIIINGLNGDQTLTARHGDAHVANIEGLVRVRESGGSTEIRDIQGSVEVEGRGGDVVVKSVTGSVTLEGNFSGAMRFGNIAQTLRFSSSRTSLSVQELTGHLTMDRGNLDATGIDGPFDLATRDKDIHLENFKSDVKLTNTNGDIHLQTATPPVRPIEVDLKRGDISLSLPTTSNFQIEAVSHHGEVSSDFPGLSVTHKQNSPSINGAYGKGGPLIRLNSTYGTIRVTRGSSEPAPSSTTTAPRQRVSRTLLPGAARITVD
jgi:DUF4097 and DUF4098 domain-containing protein YvlB